MTNSTLLKLPAKKRFFDIIRFTITSLAKEIHFSQKESDQLIQAAYELFHNAITHAYKEQEGVIEVVLHPFSYGMRIDIHDWGMPMAIDKYSSVPIDLKKERGFNRIYKLVDLFEYQNLGKNGKKFSIIKYLPHHIPQKIPNHSYPDKPKPIPKNTPILIREFQAGDEEAIARLIYQNYGYSYLKEAFYYPRKIRQAQGEKFFSIVALDQERNQIVGHFALIKMPDSPIAEIGVVVVEPHYKGMGIMNKMFDALIVRAKALKLHAIFGEAVMYHTFSQKSNTSHGFSESALLLGRAPQEVTIESNELAQKRLRGAVLVAYRVFHYPSQSLYLPKIYEQIIVKSYEVANLPLNRGSLQKSKKREHLHLYYHYDPLMNIATIVIDHYGKHFKHKFLLLLSQLRAKHCDMIYAEINMHNNPHIDKIIKILNKRGFFYAGVLYLKHKNQDYLSLQSKHSTQIGRKNLVCYSSFCQELLEYIHKDELRIKGMRK